MRHDYKEDGSYMDDLPFGEFVRKKRRLIGMNQTDFAKIIGVNQGTISQWELQITSPPFDEAVEIVRRLGGRVRILNEMLGTLDCPLGDPSYPLGYCPWQE